MSTVLITGAAGGLGGAVAERLRADGIDIIGWDAAGGDHAEVDVSDWTAVESAAANLPPLLGVVNCAGVTNRSSINDLDAAEFDRVLGINARGTFHVAKAAFPALEAGGGTFVAFGSVAGSAGFTNRIAYGASKAAVVMMVRSMAIEWAASGVRALCVSPGFVDAGMSTQGQRTGSTSTAAILSHTPLGRLVASREVADVVAFALSPAASGMTGSEIFVDGGFAALGGF